MIVFFRCDYSVHNSRVLCIAYYVLRGVYIGSSRIKQIFDADMPKLVKKIKSSLVWDNISAKYYHPYHILPKPYIDGDYHLPNAPYSHNVALQMYESFQNDDDARSLYQDTEKLIHNCNCRFSRLKKRISQMISLSDCTFCTFTFRDDVLSSTSVETRRDYVIRFLKSFNASYVANIDFGSATEREHYHALVQVPRIKAGSWQYGFDYYRKVNSSVGATDTKSSGKIARYINKLSLHASKDSTKLSKIIYSRSIKI